jgi:hypothetical protein
MRFGRYAALANDDVWPVESVRQAANPVRSMNCSAPTAVSIDRVASRRQ